MGCAGLGGGTCRVVPFLPGEGVSEKEHGLRCRNRPRPSGMGAARPGNACCPVPVPSTLPVASSPVCGVREGQTSVGAPYILEQGSLSGGMEGQID